MVEVLMTLASWHPGDENKYNPVNPGVLVSVAAPVEKAELYACAGLYYDSLRDVAYAGGVGVRVGDDKAGFDLAFLHVEGSELNDYPVVPVLGVYVSPYPDGKICFMLSPEVVGVGIAHRFY